MLTQLEACVAEHFQEKAMKNHLGAHEEALAMLTEALDGIVTQQPVLGLRLPDSKQRESLLKAAEAVCNPLVRHKMDGQLRIVAVVALRASFEEKREDLVDNAPGMGVAATDSFDPVPGDFLEHLAPKLVELSHASSVLARWMLSWISCFFFCFHSVVREVFRWGPARSIDLEFVIFCQIKCSEPEPF